MTDLRDYCRRQKPEGETRFPGATPAGTNTHAGQAGIAACWRHCRSAWGYRARRGTKETAGVNGPNLLLLQPLITRGAAGQTGPCPAPQGIEGKLLFISTEDAKDQHLSIRRCQVILELQ